ncbi:hypothetical protein LOTGIDRAFT_234548 [Lottia gigantea]|uniref:DUF7042 domain-containing protein n=1 Tax=Lottia gigantea TaxID=225164 RepID=V3ZVV1_LOTGI|nr:hypothetical protein LOTGIDRAFT_234548 [Lottia gigantea]ESO88492.1 hypothetical protein LOTGIDRAFT_234548 [Lottia gigantea]
MRILFVILSVFFISKSCEGQCVLPNNLTGTFISSSKGVLEFTSNSISGYTVSNFGAFDFNCTVSFASKLILRSNTFSYLGLIWEAYLCLDITTVSQDLFVYNLNSVEEADAQNERVKIFVQGTNPNVLTICDRTSIPAGSYELLIRNGTGTSSEQTCSSDLEGYWSYSIDNNNNNDNCSNQTTSLDVCSSTSSLAFNYTACPTLMAYSASGVVNCLQEISSGSVKYLTLLNTDQSTDESTTYRVTCMVYEVTNNGISLTQYPQACLSNQTSTSVTSPGLAITLFNRPVSTTPELLASATASWVYAVVVLIVLLVVIFIIIIGIKAYKKHQESKDESRGIKPDTVTTTVKVEGEDVRDGTSNSDMPPDILNYLQKEHSMPSSTVSKDDDIQITMSTPVQPFKEDESPGPHSIELPGAITDYHTIGGIQHPNSPRPTKKKGGTTPKTTPRNTPRNTPRTPRGGIVPRSISNLSLTKNSPRTPRGVGAKSITPRGATVKPIDSQPRVKKGVVPVMGPATNDLGRGRRLPPIVESVIAANKMRKSIGNKGSKDAKKGMNIDKKTRAIERADSAKSTTSRESIDSFTNSRPKSRSVSFRQDVEAKKKAKRMKSMSSMNQSFDEDEIVLPPNISQMKITRVDIPALALRTAESEMKLQDMDSNAPSPKQMVWSTDDNDKVEDVEAGITIRKVWLEPDDPTEEIWARVSSLWRLGQTWTDKTINM